LKKIRSHFQCTKQERSGIFFLLAIIVVLQAIYFFVQSYTPKSDTSLRLNERLQIAIDSAKHKESFKKDTLYPFNPNYLKDYKGYRLGLTTEELDRLYAYRSLNRYVNSPREFQEITKISDTLLERLSPYFKFPEWTQTTKRKRPNLKTTSIAQETRVTQDLNDASVEQLKKIYGIGDKLGTRIVRFRTSLGGFLSEEQLYDVYGLEPEVVHRILERFSIIKRPSIQKLNINTASEEELAGLLYIRYDLAVQIVAYRKVHGRFNSMEELLKIDGFPSEKIDRIQLYLSL